MEAKFRITCLRVAFAVFSAEDSSSKQSVLFLLSLHLIPEVLIRENLVSRRLVDYFTSSAGVDTVFAYHTDLNLKLFKHLVGRDQLSASMLVQCMICFLCISKCRRKPYPTLNEGNTS